MTHFFFFFFYKRMDAFTKTWLLPDTHTCTLDTYWPITSLYPGAFVLNFAPQLRPRPGRCERRCEEQWQRTDDLFCFFHIQQNRQLSCWMKGGEGRERVRGRNGGERDGDQCRSWSLPLLLYLGYISTSWQTNVLVHNSEWLRSDKGMWPVWQVIDTFFKIQKDLCHLCPCLCCKRSRLFTTRGHRLHHILWLSQIET